MKSKIFALKKDAIDYKNKIDKMGFKTILKEKQIDCIIFYQVEVKT